MKISWSQRFALAQLGGHSKSHFEGLISAQCGAPLWALIHVLDIVLDLEDAVARIGVGAEKFRRVLSLAK